MNDLSMHIIDIIQNSLSAGAKKIELTIRELVEENLLDIVIEDDGRGMTQEQVNQLENPFFTSRTTRRVGMGIPLFRDSAVQSGGGLEIDSTFLLGTKVRAFFQLDHIDRPPLGDVANSFMLMVISNPDHHFLFEYIYNGDSYLFDTEEVKAILDPIPINEPSIFKTLEEMIDSNIEGLKGGGE